MLRERERERKREKLENVHKLAAGTMFTLFFAGKDFAPDLKIGDVNIQDFLQGHYIAAMARVGMNIYAVLFSSSYTFSNFSLPLSLSLSAFVLFLSLSLSLFLSAFVLFLSLSLFFSLFF